MCVYKCSHVNPQTEAGIPSAFENISPREDDIGSLPPQFLFDNFSSTVFEQLPRDLQNMFQVDSSQEDFDGERERERERGREGEKESERVK